MTKNNNAIRKNRSMDDLKQSVSAIYEVLVKWKRNLSMFPSGKIGEDYFDECTRLIHKCVNTNQL